MRFITADYVFPVSSPPIKNGVIVTENNGSIQDVFSLENFNRQSSIYNRQFPDSKLETYRGIICPGFINTHCHLELSHLRNKLTPGKGLPHFIKEIASVRHSSEEEIKQAIARAEDEMMAAGIIAVGDISNFNHSFEQKKKGRLFYHTFIEVFDLVQERAAEEFQKGIFLMKELTKKNELNVKVHRNTCSITPHAPYTVSSKLLKLVGDYADAQGSLLSIHNQETESENEMFLSGKGKLFETLLASFGDYYKNWKATGISSLSSSLVPLPKCNKMQLVHNTYSTAQDITWAHLYSMLLWWCTCPNANLFIENKLPDYKLFLDAGCRMTVGTDSYASNGTLSILEELKTISKHASFISLHTLLHWATLNGAEFLGFDKKLGSLEKGKIPGVNLITNVDLERLRLTEDSMVERVL